MHTITFLGTGGGRYTLITQKRHTGGIWLDIGPRILLDPGPGSLIRAIDSGKNPKELDAIIVSHNHLDHYGDCEVMVEAMTEGVKKHTGVLALNRKAAEYISEYHKNTCDLRLLDQGTRFRVGGVEITALNTYNHAGATGLRFKTCRGTITYSADTGYSESLIEQYTDSKLLILNTLLPANRRMQTHLNSRDAARIVSLAKPMACIIQHFGISMINADPEKEAERIEKESNIPTIAARDGMVFNLEDLRAENEEIL